jgi:glutathione S-transferase
MSIKLYSWPRSTGTRVVWALEELGVPYEYVELDRTKGENKTDSYLAINPNAKVPALVDDGISYFESTAIFLYLGERYGVERGLWPAGGQERADALSWTVWAQSELLYNIRELLYHGKDTPISYKREDRSKAAAEFNDKTVTKHLDMLEKRLTGRDYITGAFSLVDLAIVTAIHFGTMFGLGLTSHPNVAAWVERCMKRPAAAKMR